LYGSQKCKKKCVHHKPVFGKNRKDVAVVVVVVLQKYKKSVYIINQDKYSNEVVVVVVVDVVVVGVATNVHDPRKCFFFQLKYF